MQHLARLVHCCTCTENITVQAFSRCSIPSSALHEFVATAPRLSRRCSCSTHCTGSVLQLRMRAPCPAASPLFLMQQHATPMVCRFPFYYQIKLLVVLWLIAPQTQVSTAAEWCWAAQRLPHLSCCHQVPACTPPWCCNTSHACSAYVSAVPASSAMQHE
jgi:hypothetical protein